MGLQYSPGFELGPRKKVESRWILLKAADPQCEKPWNHSEMCKGWGPRMCRTWGVIRKLPLRSRMKKLASKQIKRTAKPMGFEGACPLITQRPIFDKKLFDPEKHLRTGKIREIKVNTVLPAPEKRTKSRRTAKKPSRFRDWHLVLNTYCAHPCQLF